MSNDFLLIDRIDKIKSINEKYEFRKQCLYII